MDYINDGKYYLVRQNEIETEIIKLNEKWYLDDGRDILKEGNDISSIDLVISKFKDIEELRKRMIAHGYINDIDKLFIVSSHKFNDKEYVSEFDFIFKDGQHTEFLRNLAKERLETGRINDEETKKFMYEFITKLFTDNVFFEFMTCGMNKIESSFIEMVMKQKKEHPEYSKSDYSIMYKLGDRLKSYTFIRNIIATWNNYDELLKKYENDNNKIKKMIDSYIDEKNNNKKSLDPIKKKIDKNYIEGQMTIEEWLKENSDEFQIKTTNLVSKEVSSSNEKREYFKEILDLEDSLNNSCFDNPLLIELENKGINKIEMISYLTTKDIQKLSNKDRYKLGLIDIIEYKNSVNNGKRYN